MTQLGGIDVLMIAPNAVSQWGSSESRVVDRADNPQGNVVTATRSDPARSTRSLTWNCATRADLTALRAFLDARQGAFSPCWMPTLQHDVTVQAVVPFYGTVVTATPYSALLTEPQWCYWWARTALGVSYKSLYFNQYTDPADGTHVWNTSPGAGPSAIGNVADPFSITTANGFMVSRLLLCRMAETYRVEILGAVAVVTADFTEVPGDAP